MNSFILKTLSTLYIDNLYYQFIMSRHNFVLIKIFFLKLTCQIIFVLAHSNLNIRLVGSENNRSGRVEIYHPTFGWGTVCGFSPWGDTESDVVCRQLNFTGMKATRKNAYYGKGSVPILLDFVRCTGNESYIWDCDHFSWGIHDCYHSDDVGVECY